MYPIIYNFSDFPIVKANAPCPFDTLFYSGTTFIESQTRICSNDTSPVYLWQTLQIWVEKC